LAAVSEWASSVQPGVMSAGLEREHDGLAAEPAQAVGLAALVRQGEVGGGLAGGKRIGRRRSRQGDQARERRCGGPR